MLNTPRLGPRARWLLHANLAACRVLFGAILGLMLAMPTAAQASSALLLEPSLEGPFSPAEQAGLLSAAKEALRAQQLEIIPTADLENALAGEPQLKDCYSLLCFERLGRLLASQIVLRYRLKVSQPSGREDKPTWRINVTLLDVEVGAQGAQLTEECKNCSTAKAAEQLSDMLKRSILQNASLPRGLLEIRSRPPGATVFVDGTELGITPYKRPAFCGKHKLVLRHTGYRTEQVETQVDEGQKQHVELNLAPGNDPVQVVFIEKEKVPVYKKWWFWVAIAGGVAAAGAIAAGIAVGTSNATAASRMVPPNTYMFMF